MYSIYKHTCPNGKIYIGITSNHPEQRWNNGFGYQKNRCFFKDIVAFGWNNILHEVIAKVETQEEAAKIEKILIVSHEATNPNKGYNIQGGAPAQCSLHSDACTDTSPQGRIDNRGKAGQLKVSQFSKDGTLIATYDSMKIASKITHINHGDICSCCQGHKADGTPKHTAGGFIWRYAEDSSL